MQHNPYTPAASKKYEIEKKIEKYKNISDELCKKQKIREIGAKNKKYEKLGCLIFFCHLLPPISRWGKTVDSYKRSCRNSRTYHRKGGSSGARKVPIPFREKGAKGDTKW